MQGLASGRRVSLQQLQACQSRRRSMLPRQRRRTRYLRSRLLDPLKLWAVAPQANEVDSLGNLPRMNVRRICATLRRPESRVEVVLRCGLIPRVSVMPQTGKRTLRIQHRPDRVCVDDQECLQHAINAHEVHAGVRNPCRAQRRLDGCNVRSDIRPGALACPRRPKVPDDQHAFAAFIEQRLRAKASFRHQPFLVAGATGFDLGLRHQPP